MPTVALYPSCSGGAVAAAETRGGGGRGSGGGAGRGGLGLPKTVVRKGYHVVAVALFLPGQFFEVS